MINTVSTSILKCTTVCLVQVSRLGPAVAAVLSSKLAVPASLFSVAGVQQYRSHSISANLSLASHKVPRLHRNLCRLAVTAPHFTLAGRQFTLMQVASSVFLSLIHI